MLRGTKIIPAVTYFGGEGSSLRLPILWVELVELSSGDEPSDSVLLPDLLFFFKGCKVGYRL